jgi:predicted alpha/beta superfamily hydrolase
VAPGVTRSAEDKQPANRLVISSRVLGEERIALVRTPASYSGTAQRFPVLYLTDGATHLHHTAATIEFLARTQWVPEMIVIAIANTDRTRDLTPTRGTTTDGQLQPTSGGADKFLTFIETELLPQVDKTYRTAPYRIFAGHSFGGLLAIHAFATRNDLFNAYIAVSPSLWWDNQVAIRETEAFLKGRSSLDRTLIVTLANEKGAMRAGFDKIKELLARQQLKDFRWDSLQLEDEDHGSVALRSHYFALRKVFDGWRPTDTVMAEGLKSVEEHFRKLSAKYKYTVLPLEFVMTQVGYQLLQAGKRDEAIAVFKTNLARYPGKPHVYNSLAEAYEKNGQLDLAKQNYARAVELGSKQDAPSLTQYRMKLERVSKALEDRGK